MTDEDIEDSDDSQETIVVFRGDLYHCRERLNALLEEDVQAEIVAMADAMQSDGVPPMFEIIVLREDLEVVAELFQELWQEVLQEEGLDHEQIQQLGDNVVDLSQDTITCPGCLTEISEITEDGECIECGLFLGFPEDDDDEASAPDE